MSFFQLRNLPGYAWPPLPDPIYATVWSAYLMLDRTQWLEPAEVERRQLEQVRTLLAHCVRHVPYYSRVLPAAGVDPSAIQSMEDFRRIPLLPRRTYQEQNTALLALELPRGTEATHVRQTSGSSGSPTKVYQTNIVNQWWCAFYLRDLEWCGFDPTGTLASIRSTGVKGDQIAQMLQGVSLPRWLPHLDPLIQSGPSHVMDVQQDQRRQLQWLRKVAPNYSLSYPANLEVLAALVREEGPIPSLRAVQSISDTLTEDARAMIEAAFGVPVKNTYSCTEAGYLASPCPEGHGMHVHAENVLLEVLDEAGEPCRPGQTGRVFLTSLTNLRAPFLRYELGDEATAGPECCPCGRGLPLLARVQGKNSPLFRLANGRRKSCTPLAFLLRKIGGHWQHQVVQKAEDRVVVRLVINSAWTEAHAHQVRQKVQEFFEVPIQVDVEIHDRLAVPASGKFQNMVVEIP